MLLMPLQEPLTGCCRPEDLHPWQLLSPLIPYNSMVGYRLQLRRHSCHPAAEAGADVPFKYGFCTMLQLTRAAGRAGCRNSATKKATGRAGGTNRLHTLLAPMHGHLLPHLDCAQPAAAITSAAARQMYALM
jgi:hypothetical protein